MSERRLCALFVVTALSLSVGVGAEAPGERAPRAGLQALVDATRDGATLRLRPGVWRGPVRIDRPMVIDGGGEATILGDRVGSVIEITGRDVTLRGLTVRGSGRDTSAEAAGIKARGDGHRFVDNRVEDVYFGIHLSDGEGSRIEGNTIVPGHTDRVRPGHAISLWYQKRVTVADNVITDARDGIYLSFADDVSVVGNDVTGSRYGVHSMYSQRSRFERNRLARNLLGTALMYSSGLQMRCNRIEHHREGATAYAILLKDIDDLVLERNRLVDNRVGIYADNTPLGRDTVALVDGNLIAGSDAALALQSTVRLTFVRNTVVDNLSVVRAEGGRLGANRWHDHGGGNYWDDYAGFDRDGDGVGDLPYRYEVVFDELIRRSPLMAAFRHSPAHLALERAARAFPILERDPLVLDARPLMRGAAPACAEATT